MFASRSLRGAWGSRKRSYSVGFWKRVWFVKSDTRQNIGQSRVVLIKETPIMPTRHDEAIPIANPGFFIANVMKDCPKHTVIRELIQNAIEASGPGQTIAFFKAEWHGVPKLGLYNEGAGMTMYELEQRMAIASSGKALGF